MRPAAFAIPGDIDRKTGGFIYEKNLLLSLRAQGRPVAHVELPAGFPDPTPADTAETVRTLAALPPDAPLILDGLVYGAIDTAGLATVAAPLVAMIHHPLGLETGLPPARAAELLRREAANLALAAHVVVPSPHTARILAADFGVDPAAISVALPGFAAPDPRRAPLDPPLILSVGLIAARKGHDVLIDALSRIADLPWQAQIVGGTHDPAVRAALAAQAAPLGPRLTFRGSMAEADLAELYTRATVFALATRYEGYGMVFGEALLHGLPIVTCAAGAVPETVPPGTGHLVPVDDAAAFAAALRHLLTDAPARAAMAAASTAAGHALPRWSDTAAVMGRVLDSL
ncbi:MAG: glycosyltransferase family 4 protein [Paracoccaceae bacterium]|nr:MAG: glycosyltransferase family 4 protein [Paracoccaceae bacterium]